MGIEDCYGKLIVRHICRITGAEIAMVKKMLAELRIRADSWQPASVYDRLLLALRWGKIAGTGGADVKDIMLARAMDPATAVFDSDSSTLRYGEMDDPYTGERLVFKQAADRSGFRIELDHIVSLADAFISGGYRWSPTGRNWPKFANCWSLVTPCACCRCWALAALTRLSLTRRAGCSSTTNTGTGPRGSASPCVSTRRACPTGRCSTHGAERGRRGRWRR
jgi:hypothetical protein